MLAIMDLEDAVPKKKPEIVIGEALDLLSVAELENRIRCLEAEIARCREAIGSKQASKKAADAFFRS
jgi:uncharacterized small protein (DUF1192 family)